MNQACLMLCRLVWSGGRRKYQSFSQKWLERTPGLEGDFNFAAKYEEAINKILAESLEQIEVNFKQRYVQTKLLFITG